MATKKEIPYLQVKSAADWRKWLDKHGETEKAVRLVIPNKSNPSQAITIDEATEGALSYGWIDSLAGKYDAHNSWLTFTPRNPKSNWSKPNRLRVEKLQKAGLMMPQGQKMVDLAKQTGTWDLFADIEEGIVPPDLAERLNKNKAAKANFEAFPPSSRKRILGWIVAAKRPETRLKRIEEAIALAEKNIRANHPELYK